MSVYDVEVNNGYLSLDGEDAFLEFTELVDNGEIWEILSLLLNDYLSGKKEICVEVEPRNKVSISDEKTDKLLELTETLIKKLENGGMMVSNVIQPKVEEEEKPKSKVEVAKVEECAFEADGDDFMGGLMDMMGQFN